MWSAAFPATSQPEPHAQKLQQDGKGRALRVLDAIFAKPLCNLKTLTLLYKEGTFPGDKLGTENRRGRSYYPSYTLSRRALLLA